MVLFCTKEVLYILKEFLNINKKFKFNTLNLNFLLFIVILYNNIILNIFNFNLNKITLLKLLKKNYYNKNFSILIVKIFLSLKSKHLINTVDILLYILNNNYYLLSLIYKNIKLIKLNYNYKILKTISDNLLNSIVFIPLKRYIKAKKILNILNKQYNPILNGGNGVGKKSIIRYFNLKFLKYNTKFINIVFINIYKFFNIIKNIKQYKIFLKNIKYNKILPIFNNINLINDFKLLNLKTYNLLINSLYYNKLNLIGTTSNYNNFIKNMYIYKYIFKKLTIKEPKNKKLYKIIRYNLIKLELKYNIIVSNKILNNINKLNYLNYYSPKKDIYILNYILNKIYLINKYISNKNKIIYLNKFLLNNIFKYNTNNLNNLNLENFIIGQKYIVNKIKNYINKINLGIKFINKPKSSWLFCGPSGTGKTELSKYLSKYLFNFKKNKLIKLDMSEYMEKHSVSRLIGSPPGYVGYGEGGFLTNIVKKEKECIILFDEIEKSHKDINNIMLQILDEGYLTDSLNNKIYFNNTYIIFTSNLGCDKILLKLKSYKEGKNFTKSEYIKFKKHINLNINNYFKPEFINRLTDIFIFKPLNINNLITILDKFINQLIYKINKINNNLIIIVDKNIKLLIAKISYNPLYGARPLKKYMDLFIEKPLTNILINLKLNKKYILNFNLEKNNKKINYILKKIN